MNNRHKPVRIRFLFSIIILLVITFAQQQDPKPQRYRDDINEFLRWDSKNSYQQSATLFVGSSSIRMWQTARAFPDNYVINRGFGGSHISDVNYYYDKIVKKYQPAQIVFYAGDNDIAAGKSPEQVLQDYTIFSNKIDKDLPDTKIFYLPIKPSLSRWNVWDEMKITNRWIKEYIETKKNHFYVDIATPMLKKYGKPDSTIFLDDGLHLNNKGYQIWNEVLEDYIKN